MHRVSISSFGRSVVGLVRVVRTKATARLQNTSEVVAKAVAGVTVSVQLMALAPVAVVPDRHPSVEAFMVQAVPSGSVRNWVSNFITVDGEYFLLSDGRVLFVKEE